MSPDNARVVSGSWDTTVKMHDCTLRASVSTLEGPSDLLSGDETEVNENAISTGASVLHPNRASIDDREGRVFAVESACVSPESHCGIRLVRIRCCSVS